MAGHTGSIDEIDRELTTLDRQQEAGELSWPQLRPHGAHVLKLLIERYHLSNQIYLGTGYNLVIALRTLDEPRLFVHPLLKKRSALGDAPTWEETNRNWATATATATVLVLEVCCEVTAKKACEDVAKALSETSSRSSSGAKVYVNAPPKTSAIIKWAERALNSDGSDREILHHAIWELMLSLGAKPEWKELPQFPPTSITKVFQMTIDALMPRSRKS